MIDQNTIKGILARDTRKASMGQMQKRWEGKFVPEKSAQVKIDGRAKAQCNFNWVKHIASSYSSFVFSNKPTVHLDNPVVQQINDKMGYLNILHLENALVFGYSVEVYDGTTAKIVDPQNCTVLLDDEDNILYVLVKSVLSPNTIYNGEILAKALTLCDVYSETGIERYVFQNGNWFLSQTWDTTRLMANVFIVSPGMASFFDPALLENIDAYNANRTALFDQVVSNSDTIRVLKASQQDAQQFFSKDKNGKSAYSKMLETGIITISPDSEINDVSRNIDIGKIESDLNASRNAIYQQSFLPNLEDEITSKGGVSSISGAAIELIYSPMKAQCQKMMQLFLLGIKRRFAIMAGVRDNDYTIEFNYAVPYNKIEFYQYAKLDETLAVKDRIQSIPFVTDKKAAYDNYLEEKAAADGKTDK